MDSSEHEKAEVENKINVRFEKNGLLFNLQEPITMSLNSMTTNCNMNDEDSSSFVVIGKDSMDAQASILGSYVDIHQKSMSTDYKLMVSSMSIGELQQRLTEMLQENVKLKETLKQSNLSMKQQFNTLAMWQEELMKVHQNHKQKFAETKEFVKHLKSENNELKNKLQLLQQTDDTEWMIPASDINHVSNEAEHQQNMPQFTDAMSKIDQVQEDVEKWKQHVLKHISVISEKFAEKELENKLQQLKVEKDLDSAMKSLSSNTDSAISSKNVESPKCSEACSAKDQKITCLTESITLLEQKLQCALTPIELHSLSRTSSSLDHQKFIQSMKQYNDILQELTECFTAQIVRYVTIEQILKEITDIVMILDDDNSKMQSQQYREKLCHCCKQLADEQVKIITDRQVLIKSQNQFQKILSDYNSILHELEITIDENAKLNVLKDNTARESFQKSEELEQIKRDQQSLEQEKRILDQEKNNLEEQKQLFEDQKKNLDMERISLNAEKKLLAQEKISLNEEKMSLDHQSQLYEDCEKTLQNEKKILQVRYDKLIEKMNNLRLDFQKIKTDYEKVLAQLVQSTEENDLLRSQLTIYEEDFQAEKRLKEKLLEEKSKLDMELQKQVEFNKQLQESAMIYKQTGPSIASEQTSEGPNNSSATCPKCHQIFRNLSTLMAHIETCLDP